MGRESVLSICIFVPKVDLQERHFSKHYSFVVEKRMFLHLQPSIFLLSLLGLIQCPDDLWITVL